MKLIVGLGNPDKKYADTRHNIGFMALDNIQRHFESAEFKKQASFQSQISEFKHQNEKIILVKPLTYMNLSGEAVQSIMGFYKINPEDLIVIYDDIDLDLSRIRIKTKGSAGTHNGMKSIVSKIGDNFTRIRIGIKGESYEDKPIDLAGYVLSNFKQNEQIILNTVLEKLPEIINKLLTDTSENVMNKYNN